MQGIFHGPGEGESLFGGRIVLKSGLEQLSVTESWFATARPGADLHFHREHADSFYVLEGELAIRIGDEEHLVGPGGTVSAPPGFVHGFRSTMPTRFLNFHTPDARFAEHLRELDRGEPGGFDSVDATAPGDGLTETGAVLLHAGEGEALRANHRVATIKVGTDELCLIEFELEPTHEGPDPAQPHRPHGLVLRARRLGQLPARRREDRGRPGVVRGRAARGRARLQDRPERRPDAQHPCAEHGLSRPPARDGLGATVLPLHHGQHERPA